MLNFDLDQIEVLISRIRESSGYSLSSQDIYIYFGLFKSGDFRLLIVYKTHTGLEQSRYWTGWQVDQYDQWGNLLLSTCKRFPMEGRAVASEQAKKVADKFCNVHHIALFV